jgi:lysophospholipase L1-like esterase
MGTGSPTDADERPNMSGTLRGRVARLAAVAALVGAPVAFLGSGGASAAAVTSQVGLGDSYASGPVITPQDPTLPGCLRSLVNYPHLVAQQKGYALTDVSCSGATTQDMFSAQSTDAGTNPPQLSALTPGTGIVTLTIGGNDIGFTGIIKQCLAEQPNGPTASGSQTCKAFYTAGGTDQLAARVAATRPKVDNVLTAIHQRSPHAKIYLAGYADILPETGPGCWPQMPLTPTDVAYLRDIEKNLNGMLASSAAANGAVFVDTYGPTIGRDACQLPVIRDVEPVIPVQDAAPVHPNRAGERAMADAVLTRIG